MPKVNWTSAGNSSQCGCCGDCDLIFQSLTASLPLHGFSPYDCDGEGSSSDTRYLSITYSGMATSGCGPYKKHGEASRTYTIDPMTGYQCISGDSEPRFWCNQSREADQCSATSRKWDCGIISNSEKNLNCGVGKDSEGNTLRKPLTESLSQPYTLNGVESNVDALLSQNPITDTSMPPGAAGTVVAGTGHSIITWQAGAATSAYFYKGSGHVMKTKLRIKFPTARTYKLVTKDEDGNVISEVTREATAGQFIDVPPPSSPGYTSVDPSCGFPTLGTSLECNVSGGYTTRRRVCRDDSYEEIPCPPCPMFIGPDCKEYNTITHVKTASASRSWADTVTGVDYYASSDHYSGNASNTFIEHACPYREECVEISGSASRTEIFQEGDPETCEVQVTSCESGEDCFPAGNGCSAKYEYTSPDLNYYGAPCDENRFIGYPSYGTPLSLLCGHASCSKTITESFSIVYEPPNHLPEECRDAINESFSRNSTTTQNIVVSGNTVSSSFSHNGTGQFDGTYEEGSGEWACFQPGTVSTAYLDQKNCDYTSTYSNTDNPDDDGDENGWESETLPWCSGEQTEDCMSFSGCVERYLSANFSTSSTASISCTASFTAPEVSEEEGPKNFNTWFHYYTVEDSGPSGIETNLGAVGCRVRTVVAHNSQVGSSSRGGEVSISGPSVSLSTSDGKTECLIGPIAYTYELPVSE